MTGGSVLPPRLNRNADLNATTHPDAPLSIKDIVTPRQFEFIKLRVAGFNRKEIARYFELSESGVNSHWQRIYEKLGISNVVELCSRYHSERTKGLYEKDFPTPSALSSRSILRPEEAGFTKSAAKLAISTRNGTAKYGKARYAKYRTATVGR